MVEDKILSGEEVRKYTKRWVENSVTQNTNSENDDPLFKEYFFRIMKALYGLEKKGYIEWVPGEGIRLTKKGEFYCPSQNKDNFEGTIKKNVHKIEKTDDPAEDIREADRWIRKETEYENLEEVIRLCEGEYIPRRKIKYCHLKSSLDGVSIETERTRIWAGKNRLAYRIRRDWLEEKLNLRHAGDMTEKWPQDPIFKFYVQQYGIEKAVEYHAKEFFEKNPEIYEILKK